jgi:hypothetical protein
MKKHLIAAAVAAAFAVPAMAQVTLSGTYGIGYGKGLSSTQGFRVTDGHLTAAATEDLGAGMRATASIEIRTRGREDRSGYMRNATASISGGFGTITGGGIEFANGIFARGSAGTPLSLPNQINEDNLVLNGQANSEYVQYRTPELVKGLTFGAIYADAVGAGRGADTTQATKNTYSLTGQIFYATGPIDAAYEYTSFNRPDDTTRIRNRTSASYNFGAFVIGAGYETRETTAVKANSYDEYVVGLRVPFGATQVGVVYAKNDTNNNSVWALGVQHALSKRTSINFSFADKDGTAAHPSPTGTTDRGTLEGTQYSIRLLHSF